jgi:hypothetical protein
VYIYFPVIFVFSLLIELSLGWYMSTESSVYLGVVDGGSHHTWNLASAAWVVYSLEGLLASSGGVCLCPSMKNVVKYNVVI